jgi:hypothetical protein
MITKLITSALMQSNASEVSDKTGGFITIQNSVGHIENLKALRNRLKKSKLNHLIIIESSIQIEEFQSFFINIGCIYAL